MRLLKIFGIVLLVAGLQTALVVGVGKRAGSS